MKRLGFTYTSIVPNLINTVIMGMDWINSTMMKINLEMKILHINLNNNLRALKLEDFMLYHKRRYNC